MTITCTCTTEGEQLKLDAHLRLDIRRDVYVNRGRRALLERLLDAGLATADDVRDAVTLPASIDPVCLGAVPGQLARAGIIVRVAFTESRRRDAHSRPVSVWQLADRAAAVAWLAAHPDVSDTPTEADHELPLFAFYTNAAADGGTSAGQKENQSNV